MFITQKQRIEAYQRVQAFLAEHPLPDPGYGEPQRLLDAVVARLTEHSTDQVSGRRLGRAEGQREVTLEKVLREQHLRPIAKIANATLRGSPGLDKATRMPRSNLSVTELLVETRAFRTAAEPYQEQFVRNGRPADFLARLDAAAEELRRAFLGKAHNLGKRLGAKDGMKDEIKRGRDAIEMLDATVTTIFAGNGQVLAQWRSARRIRGVSGGSGSGAETPDADTPASQPGDTAGAPSTPPKAA